MKKNGKNVLCKKCGALFYISASRFTRKKYCSFQCALDDNCGFKEKKKNCVICRKEFLITRGTLSQKTTCSSKCHIELAKIISQRSVERRKLVQKTSVCRWCKNSFTYSNSIGKRHYCSPACYSKKLSEDRQGRGNPAYRNGYAVSGKRTYTGRHLRACAKYRKAFFERNDRLYCEVCGVNDQMAIRFEVHHIYYASRFPRHLQLHNPLNLILICIRCHNDFHGGKKKDAFQKLEKERGLQELFEK